MPSDTPTKKHQKVIKKLLRFFDDHAPKPLEAIQEQEIRLEDDLRRNPDIIVAR